MRQWISLQREAFHSTLKLRRALIDAGAFDNLPFRKRIWPAHLQFVWLVLRPIRMQAGSILTLLVWRAEELYCRTADRLVGGKRFERFVERCERQHEKIEKNLQQSQKRLDEIAEARFDLRLLQESLQNPNFVATPTPTKTANPRSFPPLHHPAGLRMPIGSAFPKVIGLSLLARDKHRTTIHQ